jgi:secretion/DNA translocation related TadE-like protein
MLVGVVAALRSTAVLARHRAESAADFAALAAAGQIGVSVGACAAAGRVAAANGAALVGCRVDLASDGRSGVVDVEVRLAVRLPIAGRQQIVATARAARLPAATA